MIETRVYEDIGIDFDGLLDKFVQVQNKHKEYKKVQRTKEISTMDRDAASTDV